MSWISTMARWVTSRRDERRRRPLLDVNNQQLNRVRSGETMDRLVGTDNTPTYGEAAVFSGVLDAAEKAATPFADQIDALAAEQATRHENITSARAELRRIGRQHHIVGTHSRRSGHHHDDPEGSGDSISVAEAESELAELKYFLAEEKKGGARRHMHAVPSWVSALAVAVLFIDVLALFALTSGLENASFLPADWRRDPVDSAIRAVTAMGFAALAASVLALLAHFVGVFQWQVIHRREVDATSPGTADGAHADGDPRGIARFSGAIRGALLPLSWIGMIAFASVMGSTMYLRVQMAAQSSSKYESIALPIGMLIALAAVVAPVVVALAAALKPSPEVHRRDALAVIVEGAEQDRQRLSASIQAEITAATTLVEQAEQLRTAADRAVRRAILPATQAVISHRAEFGYAGEQYTPLAVVGDGTRPGLFDLDPLCRIERSVSAMRVAAPAEPEDLDRDRDSSGVWRSRMEAPVDDLRELEHEF